MIVAHHACLEQGAGQRLHHKYLPDAADVLFSSALEVKVEKALSVYPRITGNIIYSPWNDENDTLWGVSAMSKL